MVLPPHTTTLPDQATASVDQAQVVLEVLQITEPERPALPKRVRL